MFVRIYSMFKTEYWKLSAKTRSTANLKLFKNYLIISPLLDIFYKFRKGLQPQQPTPWIRHWYFLYFLLITVSTRYQNETYKNFLKSFSVWENFRLKESLFCLPLSSSLICFEELTVWIGKANPERLKKRVLSSLKISCCDRNREAKEKPKHLDLDFRSKETSSPVSFGGLLSPFPSLCEDAPRFLSHPWRKPSSSVLLFILC